MQTPRQHLYRINEMVFRISTKWALLSFLLKERNDVRDGQRAGDAAAQEKVGLWSTYQWHWCLLGV
jgi:hypothetical protein